MLWKAARTLELTLDEQEIARAVETPVAEDISDTPSDTLKRKLQAIARSSAPQ
jgi:hypothetical protein